MWRGNEANSKFSEDLKNDIKIFVGHMVLYLLIKILFINNSKIAWPAEFLIPFLCFSENLLLRCINNFSAHSRHKTQNMLNGKGDLLKTQRNCAMLLFHILTRSRLTTLWYFPNCNKFEWHYYEYQLRNIIG